MDQQHVDFLNKIKGKLPSSRIYTDALNRLAWGTDASFYRLTPQIVVRAANEEEVSMLLAAASEAHVPVTFRAAGTSLSGQAVTDSVLIVAGKHWEQYTLSEDHKTITMQPGIIGAEVNRILAPYGRYFGPDPASVGSCMVGGIVMNNASGMSCGVHANSDKEIISARIVLADGTVLDTGDPESRKAFKARHPEILEGIEQLRSEVCSDAKLVERIKYKYSIKNVTGLNLLPLATLTDPFDILTHTLVGSEGTLAFLSRVTMHTQPLAPFKASAMIYFSDIREAARAVVALRGAKTSAAELLDKRSLAAMHDLTGENLTALLIETRADSKDQLDGNIAEITQTLKQFNTYKPFSFTDDPKEYSKFWAIRSGVFPAVGGMRKTGTTCLIEDVAFHINDLPEATADLSALLDKHGYDDSCIYGHALEGNFHFIINQDFSTTQEVERYKSMITDLVHLVIDKYDGSLKAEHGTGRNMAPFVEYEWGEKALGIMRRIKTLFDPAGILNPGVIFNDDPECYVKHIKAMPIISSNDNTRLAKINKCIECGFCEVNCVSCGFSMSARTRIVAVREMERLRRIISTSPEAKSNSANDVTTAKSRLAELEKEYAYKGNVTCAADGLCSMSCPMGINVADLTQEVRRAEVNAHPLQRKAGTWAAKHFVSAKNMTRFALDTANLGERIFGAKIMSSMCRWFHRTAKLPLWTPSTPASYNSNSELKRQQQHLRPNSPKVVYLPSCVNQAMGLPLHAPYKLPLVKETCHLLHKAGYEVIFPRNMQNLCCGEIWESKGMPDIAAMKLRETKEALTEASEGGKYPILCDQSPCLHLLRERIDGLKLYEPAEFIYKFLRDRLDFHQTDKPVAVHLTCSTRLMGIDNIFVSLAQLCSSNVTIPNGVGCCAFAGDKGFTHPELNKYALRKLRDQVKDCKAGYSNSRTCEIGLATNSGIPYFSIVYLVDECTTPKNITQRPT